MEYFALKFNMSCVSAGHLGVNKDVCMMLDADGDFMPLLNLEIGGVGPILRSITRVGRHKNGATYESQDVFAESVYYKADVYVAPRVFVKGHTQRISSRESGSFQESACLQSCYKQSNMVANKWPEVL